MKIDTYTLTSEELTYELNRGADILLDKLANHGVISRAQYEKSIDYTILCVKQTTLQRIWERWFGEKAKPDTMNIVVVRR